jgi:Flp pilus assembly protein TadD
VAACLIGLAGVVVGACQAVQKGVEPVKVERGILTLATVPPGPTPTPEAPSTGPGREAFDEAQRLLAAGDTEGALRQLAQAVAEAPENGHYAAAYADALWKSGAPEAREEALARAADAARLEPGRRADYAAYLDLAGRTREAAQEYEKIVEANPQDYAALATLGGLWLRTGDSAKALPILQEAAQRRSGDPAVIANLGAALEKSGDLAGAAQAYGSALSANPQDSAVRGRLAEVFFQMGDAERAVRECEAGLQAAPGSPDLQRGLGGLLERAGRTTEAAAAYREYARLSPSAADAKDLAVRAQQLEARAQSGR